MVRAERTDILADALAELLAVPVADPLQEEVVVVPARGVERWLTQRLSHRLGAGAGAGVAREAAVDGAPAGPETCGARSPGVGAVGAVGFAPGGVCAGVRFLSPASLVSMLTGRERDDPWDPDRLVWSLLSVIDESLDASWCAPIARHLGHGLGPATDGVDSVDGVDEIRAGRRYSLARRLAGLFASYGVQRPTLLTDWREGRSLDGVGAPLDPDLAWQPELYRRLLDRVEGPPPDVRHQDTLDRLRAGAGGFAAGGAEGPSPGAQAPLALPGRLSLFGHTRIARTEIELLAALARHRDVHLWLPQASEAVWRAIEPECAIGPIRRAQDRTGELVAHPLLASLGRDARELQRSLALAAAEAGADAGARAGAGPLGPGPADRPPTPTPATTTGRAAVIGPVEAVEEVPNVAEASGADAAPGTGTILGWLQHDLRAGRPPTPQERAARVPATGDASVRIHACHGPARQVEVLREVLVGLLADDPTLEPRDIIVMCPDIEAYAPLVQAAFGLGGGVDEGGGRGARHPAHRLRVRLADRSLTATNPLARLAADLLGLVGGRMTAGDVLDLAGSAPVRRRFGFDDDDLDRIARWVDQAAIRWGRDARSRAPFDLERFDQNTWRFGLDRLLLGVATGEDRGPDEERYAVGGAAGQGVGARAAGEALDGGQDPAGEAVGGGDGAAVSGVSGTGSAADEGLGGSAGAADEPGADPVRGGGNVPADLLPALPVDDVGGGDIDLVGRLAELLDRLDAVVDRLEAARTAADWTDALREGVRDLADVPLTETWQVAQLKRELAAVAAASRPDTRLRLADVRGLLAHRFAGHPTRANFRTGTLTVATMVPMRSVPHRVVALLGLDDGVYPRQETVDGDDALSRDPMTGERDPRSEDRQLLLDAIMAATEHLVVTYTGASEHAGSPRPPAVPLGEAVDAVRETIAPELDADGREVDSPSFVVRHRLQPFAPENFVDGALGAPGPFSFDAASLAGARAMAGERTPVPPLLTEPLSATPVTDVDLDDLLAFFAHPARHVLRGRLDVTAPLEGDEPLDAMPVDLDSLEKWAVGDRLLGAALAGVHPDVAVRAERLRGLLPPGGLADPVLADVRDVIGAVVTTANGLRVGTPGSVDVDVDLGGGRRLSGTVPHVYGTPTGSGGAARHVTVSYSSVSAKRRLEAWITLLALAASDDSIAYTSHALGRRGRRAVTAVAGPIDPATARAALLDLVDVYDRGRLEPLPIPPRTALAYAEAHARGARGERVDAEAAARDEWVGRDNGRGIPGEAADAWHVRVHGPQAPLEVLLTDPRPGEDWNTAPHRLGRYALRVWEPVLAAQEVR